MTASPAYSSVSTISENSTVLLAIGDTPSAVFSSPWTTHGCRPASVNVQPALLAISGANRPRIASRVNHLPGSRPLRINQRPAAARPTMKKPRPIMIRNDQ